MKYYQKLFIFLFGFFCFVVFASASVAAQTGAKPFDIALSGVKIENNRINATVKITNPNNVPYEHIFYATQLLSPDEVGTRLLNDEIMTVVSQGALITFQNASSISLGANESKTVAINLPYSSHIASGPYTLSVALTDANNDLLGSVKKTVSLKGDGLAVRLTNCVVVTGGVVYSSNIGPNVAPKAAVYGQCSVENPTSNAVTVSPVSVYAVDQVLGNVGSAKKLSASSTKTTVPSGRALTVRFPLPALETPQVYQAISYLVDGKSMQISQQVSFRWVVAGASSSIRSITLDATSYTKGQTAKVTVAADPSMDLFWQSGGPATYAPLGASGSAAANPFVFSTLSGTPLQNPKLVVSIKNGDGVLCGQKEQAVIDTATQTSWNNQTVSIPVREDCQNPHVSATVKDGTKELAKKEVTVMTPPSTTSQLQQSILAVVAFLVLVAVVVGGLLYWKKQKGGGVGAKTAGSVAIFLLVFFGSVQTVSAQVLLGPPLEKNPGEQVSIAYSQIDTPNPTCAPLPAGTPGTFSVIPNPHGLPGCVTRVTLLDKIFWDFLDTQNDIALTPSGITVKVQGTLSGAACQNASAGLIVRAFVDGTAVGVKINGGSSKLMLNNLLNLGSGAAPLTNIDQTLLITPGVGTLCGSHTVKVELIPFINHVDVAIASDPAENIINTGNIYGGVSNCGVAGRPCYGVLTKVINWPSCVPTPTPTPVAACNTPCTRAGDCTGDAVRDGCTSCLPNAAGTGKTCQKQACNARCETRDDCAADNVRNGNVCSECVANGQGVKTCQPVATPTPTPILMCNKSCTSSQQCATGIDGCTACIPNDTGAGSSCKPSPACGTSCKKDSQCAGAKNGCSICGSAGKCTAFSEDMCKCDGMDFQPAKGDTTFFPGDDVSFIAFGKVEGTNINVADLQSMTFSLYQSTLKDPNKATRIAQSSAITPQIVQSDSSKARYKVTWNQKIPATVPSGSLFRVQAVIKCVAKPGVLGAATTSLNTNYYADVVRVIQGILGNTQSVLAAATQNQQQATSFFPGAKISEKSCSILKFYFE